MTWSPARTRRNQSYALHSANLPARVEKQGLARMRRIRACIGIPGLSPHWCLSQFFDGPRNSESAESGTGTVRDVSSSSSPQFARSQSHFHARTRVDRRPGFTLLETILAIALSALLLGLIAAGMRIYTSVVSDRRADVVNAQVARVVLQRIADDLQASYYGSPAEDQAGGTASADSDGTASDDGEGSSADSSADDVVDATADLTGSTVQATPGLYGNQFELQIDAWGQFAKPVRFDMLAATGLDPMSSNLLSNPKTVTYYLRAADESELAGTPLQSVQGSSTGKTILVRRVQNRAQAAFDTNAIGVGDSQLGEQLLSDQVVAIEFAYHDGYDWLDLWDSSLTSGLPIAVRITVTVVAEVASENVDLSELTTDNMFQRIVRLPTAELPEEDTAGF